MAGPRKPLTQRVEEIDQKIADYENKIASLKEKREEMLHPVSYNDIIKEAKKRKLSPKKLAQELSMDNLLSRSSSQEPQAETAEQEE